MPKKLPISPNIRAVSGKGKPTKERPVARAKMKLQKPPEKARSMSRLWIGADLSLHSLALAGLGYDAVLKKHVGPNFISVTWNKHDDYFSRLKELANCYDFIIQLQAEMKMAVEPEQIFIAVEEPWPFGLVGRGKGHSQTLKQQAEMSGAFLSGLVRYGYQNVFQINSALWRKLVADDLGITTHYSKWGKGIEGKMRPKEWALRLNDDNYWRSVFPNEIPVWPDMIRDDKDGGRKPQPETSTAIPLQPDDRYQALPMALWMKNEETT